jgi:hypothetical protein
LFEGKEFKDAQVYAGMKPQSSLKRSEGIVEFNKETPVDLYFAFIILPGHFEEDYALGFRQPVDEADCIELWMPVVYLLDAFKDFPDGLQKFFLTRILFFKTTDYIVRIHKGQV